MMVGHVLGLEFEFIEPNTQAGDLYQPEYEEKNPMHTIPLLEDGDFTVVDSHAIAVYLITKFGADKRKTLYPEDIYLTATIDARLHFDTGVLFPRLRAIIDPTMSGLLSGPNDEIIAKVDDAYQMLETYLNKTQFLACDHFTVADICAGATVTSLNTLIPVEGDRFPKLIDWITSLYEQECFMEINAAGVQEFSAFMNQCWETNRANAAPPMYYYMAR